MGCDILAILIEDQVLGPILIISGQVLMKLWLPADLYHDIQIYLNILISIFLRLTRGHSWARLI
jgi:hypothetical protein